MALGRGAGKEGEPDAEGATSASGGGVSGSDFAGLGISGWEATAWLSTGSRSPSMSSPISGSGRTSVSGSWIAGGGSTGLFDEAGSPGISTLATAYLRRFRRRLVNRP